MVFQTFDNTDPHEKTATDPLAKPLRQTASPLKATVFVALGRSSRKPRVENSACKIGITVYHQTHQR
ncbi:hypothetical protein YSA_09529 [Pseudomonas putida ND6]|uniref:Uncharacterized protein n=1 Tax=Pseudomonas putida ND6 TaxID=231023 RepID=I3V2G2_PSEPU|nr:hypothetical protein YSA_09529 [Pseudomonas putida ND6]